MPDGPIARTNSGAVWRGVPSKYLKLRAEADEPAEMAPALHYRHAGVTTLPDVPPPLARGTAFVFLAGEGGSAAHFEPQISALAAAHSPLALDLPGHGRSTGLAGPSDLAAAAAVVSDALGRLAAPPAVLVGHGFGGWIALAVALAAPDRVRAVCTLGTASRCEWPEAELEKLEAVVSGRSGQFFDTPFFAAGTAPDVMRAFFGALVTTDPRVRLDDLRIHRDALPLADLGRLGVPVRVVRGAEDSLCTAEGAAELASACGVDVDEIAGAGHVPQLEQPEAVNALLREVGA